MKNIIKALMALAIFIAPFVAGMNYYQISKLEKINSIQSEIIVHHNEIIKSLVGAHKTTYLINFLQEQAEARKTYLQNLTK